MTINKKKYSRFIAWAWVPCISRLLVLGVRITTADALIVNHLIRLNPVFIKLLYYYFILECGVTIFIAWTYHAEMCTIVLASSLLRPRASTLSGMTWTPTRYVVPTRTSRARHSTNAAGGRLTSRPWPCRGSSWAYTSVGISSRPIAGTVRRWTGRIRVRTRVSSLSKVRLYSAWLMSRHHVTLILGHSQDFWFGGGANIGWSLNPNFSKRNKYSAYSGLFQLVKYNIEKAKKKHVITSHYHYVTLSLLHIAITSHCHYVTLTLRQTVITSAYHYVTLLLRHPVVTLPDIKLLYIVFV